ncbi:MAG: Crp/Fnr family transcriptional regulator [Comamonadaceae bacterium]|nr:MAG: Crp/Fnr family transcriptional regulator [Comamonadaceae bacterium]
MSNPVSSNTPAVPTATAFDLDLIRRVPLFSGLTQVQAEIIAGAVSRRHYRRGDNMVEQGRKTDSLFIILSGRAHVISGNEQLGEVILETLRPGDHFGEMSLIDNQAHSATVRADSDLTALVLGRAEFTACLPENNSMAYTVLKALVSRLRSANLNIESLALMDVYGRIAKVLLDLAETDGDGNAVVREKVSRMTLARMVGASREAVSRALADIVSRGMVEIRDDGSMLIRGGISRLR